MMTLETIVANGNSQSSRYVNYFGEWQLDELVTNCLNCQIKFSFLIRKHHCRCCGGIYCGSCCSKYGWYDKNRVKVVSRSKEYDEIAPFRTCDSCYQNLLNMKLLRTSWGEVITKQSEMVGRWQRRPVACEVDSINSSSVRPFGVVKNNNNGVESVRETSSEANAVTTMSSEDMSRCPICNFDLKVLGPDQTKHEEHVTMCIEQAEFAQQRHTGIGSPTYQNRMLVYKVPVTSELPAECPICFEDLEPNQKVGRLECLCVFHLNCIKSWFRKKAEKIAAQNSTTVGIETIGKNYCPFHDAIM